jgi:putative transposase
MRVPGRKALRRPASIGIGLKINAFVGRSIMAGHSIRRHRKNYNEPGHAHELTFSCYRGFPFLSKERCCGWLADAIMDARRELEFDLWAYVFMPEHVHLIVQPRKRSYDIAQIRSRIKQPPARRAIAYLRKHAPDWLTRLEVRKGDEVRHQFWQKGGGYDRNITEPATLQRMINYIHLNPVRRGLIRRACEWKWSSAAYLEGQGESILRLDQVPPEWLVE